MNKELLKRDILYRFFSNEIDKVDYEIKKNAEDIAKLAKKQTELKRGKAELISLRRELRQRAKEK